MSEHTLDEVLAFSSLRTPTEVLEVIGQRSPEPRRCAYLLSSHLYHFPDWKQHPDYEENAYARALGMLPEGLLDEEGKRQVARAWSEIVRERDRAIVAVEGVEVNLVVAWERALDNLLPSNATVALRERRPVETSAPMAFLRGTPRHGGEPQPPQQAEGWYEALVDLCVLPQTARQISWEDVVREGARFRESLLRDPLPDLNPASSAEELLRQVTAAWCRRTAATVGHRHIDRAIHAVSALRGENAALARAVEGTLREHRPAPASP